MIRPPCRRGRATCRAAPASRRALRDHGDVGGSEDENLEVLALALQELVQLFSVGGRLLLFLANYIPMVMVVVDSVVQHILVLPVASTAERSSPSQIRLSAAREVSTHLFEFFGILTETVFLEILRFF